MAGPQPLYDISVWLEVEDEPGEVARELVEALGSLSPAQARGVRTTAHGVTVDFPDMKAREPMEGLGDIAVEPADMQRLLPVVQALVSVSAARVKAGLTPSERIVIDLKPAEQHRQDELRHG